jgi:hypothetical protein
MEQLQQVTKFLKQHGFWIVCVLATLATAGVWYWGSDILTTETVGNRDKLKGRIKQISDIYDEKKPHPNSGTEDQIAGIILLRESKLFKAWEMLVNDQDGTLKWDDKFKTEYPESFEKVSKMRPIEAFKDVEVEKSFLTLYRDYHRELFPPLAEKIGAKWPLSVSGDPAAGGLNRDVGDVIVDWHPKNQTDILNDHFSWPGQSGGIPTAIQMLYAQEDFWVLDSIVDTIKRVNGDVESRHKAAIKTIEYIKLGKNIDPRSGTVKIKTSGGFETEATKLVNEETTRAPRARGRVGETEVAQAVNPAENRYVDLKYKPLSAVKLDTAMKGANVNDARLSVAKRMPVQMRLVINQKEINRFLIECGNSDLPIEIRQVRLGDVGSSAGDQLANNNDDTDVSPADLTVELYGIVYIFNPPNEKLLNIKEPANTDGG